MNIGQIAAKIELDASNFFEGVDKVNNSTKKLSNRFKKVGTNLSLGLTAPLALLGQQIVSVAGDFEAQMQGVKAITKATGAEFSELNNKAKELGSSTKFSASQAAEGMEILARNGLNATQILGGAIDASLNLASATGANLSTAADVATDVMASFNKEAKDLGAIVDNITGFTVNSKFAIEDYAFALGSAGGVAGQLGVSINDFNTALAATSSSFASGSDAGTSFKNFLLRLNPATKEARSMMQKLGLEFKNSDGSFKSLSEISGQLQKAFENLSESQRAQAAETIFGADALRTALTLAKTGADGFDELAEKINGVSAAQQSATRQKGFNAALLSLQSALEGLQIAIANSGLLEFVTNIVKRITAFTRALSQTSPEILKLVTVFGAVAAAIGPLLLSVGGLIRLLPILKLAFTALTGPIGLSIAAIVASITLIATNWEEITNYVRGNTFIQMAFKALKKVAKSVFDSIKSIIDSFKTSAGSSFSDISEAAKFLGDIFVKFLAAQATVAFRSIEAAISLFLGVLSSVINVAVGLLSGLVKLLKGDFAGAWDSVRQGFLNAFDSILKGLGGVWDAVTGLMGDIEESSKSTSRKLAQNFDISDALTMPFKDLEDQIKTTGDAITEARNKLAQLEKQGAGEEKIRALRNEILKYQGDLSELKKIQDERAKSATEAFKKDADAAIKSKEAINQKSNAITNSINLLGESKKAIDNTAESWRKFKEQTETSLVTGSVNVLPTDVGSLFSQSDQQDITLGSVGIDDSKLGNMDDEANSVENLRNSLLGLYSAMNENAPAWVSTTENAAMLKEGFTQLEERVAASKEIWGQFASSAIQSMGSAVSSLIQGGEQAKGAISGLIGALISQGVTAVVSGALLKSASLGPFAVPIAAAAGAAAQALFTRIIPEFADGGIVKGETLALVGEYAGASGNPEVIAPLNKLQGYLNNAMDSYMPRMMSMQPAYVSQDMQTVNVNVTGSISGENIRLSQSNLQRNARYNRP